MEKRMIFPNILRRVAVFIKKQAGRLVRKIEGDTRRQQLIEERNYWTDWIASGGREFPEDYICRLDPSFPLQRHIARFAERLESDAISILDVGAGPLTSIGKVHPTKNIRITATDLLAPKYDEILKKNNIRPVVRTIYADAHDLQNHFGSERFDIVYAQNSIDHTVNPMHVIDQMLSVTRLGGFVVLLHAENEGMNEGYQQLHKWDFECDNGQFIISGPGPHGNKVNATRIFSKVGRVECEKFFDGYGGGGKNLPLTTPGVLVSIQKIQTS
jgi:SAM-dependent methyltransferase